MPVIMSAQLASSLVITDRCQIRADVFVVPARYLTLMPLDSFRFSVSARRLLLRLLR